MKRNIYLIMLIFLTSCNSSVKTADLFLQDISDGKIVIIEGLWITIVNYFDDALISDDLLKEGIKDTNDKMDEIKLKYVKLPKSITSFELIDKRETKEYLWESIDISDENYKLYDKVFKTKTEFVRTYTELYKEKQNFRIDEVNEMLLYQELIPTATIDYKVTTTNGIYKVIMKLVKKEDVLTDKKVWKIAQIASMPI